jgi:hypothetical protein
LGAVWVLVVDEDMTMSISFCRFSAGNGSFSARYPAPEMGKARAAPGFSLDEVPISPSA